jgi:hypothetical protein
MATLIELVQADIIGGFDRIVACLFSRDDLALYRRILAP